VETSEQPQPRIDRCAVCGSAEVYVTALLAVAGAARLAYCREHAEQNDERRLFKVGSARRVTT
jgi:hypothetical protein